MIESFNELDLVLEYAATLGEVVSISHTDGNFTVTFDDGKEIKMYVDEDGEVYPYA